MKNYPPEFKADVVALYGSRPEATIRSVAADLGINRETLRNWVRVAGVSGPRGRRTQEPAQPPAPMEAENAALRKKVATYGPGEFCNFLSLHYPHAPREAADLTEPMPARLRQQIEEVRHNARQPWPLPHLPEQLFAMGVTGNGDYLFWVTQPSDKSDAWDVAVNQALRAPWYTFTGTLTEFLIAVISGTTRVPIFPGDLLDNGPTFTPARPIVEPTTPTDQQGSMNPAEIRAWAHADGRSLPDRGRIPIEIIEAWKRANAVCATAERPGSSHSCRM